MPPTPPYRAEDRRQGHSYPSWTCPYAVVDRYGQVVECYPTHTEAQDRADARNRSEASNEPQA